MKRILLFLLKEKKNIIISIVLSLILMLLSYEGNNIKRPLLENNDIIRFIEYYWGNSSFLANLNRNTPNDYLLINTAYDKISIPKYEYEEKRHRIIGEQQITDRKKLLEFLEIAQYADYKYIIIDLDFSEDLKYPDDSINKKLADLMLSMRNVYIPAVLDKAGNPKRLFDERLNEIANTAVAIKTWRINNLTPLPLYPNGIKSIPLDIYEDSTHNEYKEHLLYSTIGGKLCYKKIFVYNYVRERSVQRIDSLSYKNHLYSYLGVDYLDPICKQYIPALLEDFIVIIGDTDNDVITSYSGSIAGSLVLLNEFYSLMASWNIVKWQLAILCFLLYFTIFFCISNGWSIWSYLFNKIKFHNPIVKKIIIAFTGSLFSNALLLNLVKVILFYFFHIYFCVYIPIIIIPYLSIFLNPAYKK